MDNSSVVYNKSDIDAIIESNNNPVEDEDPVEPEQVDSDEIADTSDNAEENS